MDPPEFRGGAVTFPQAVKDLLVKAGAAAGAGVPDGRVGLPQDRDDVPGPVLEAAGAEFQDLAGPPDNVLVIPISG